MDQIGIGVPGLIAVWLTQHRDATWHRYACLFGFSSQPFWFYSSVTNEQWGIFALNVAYTFIWGRSVWRLWIRP